ncbi:probable cyclic nucleotide-gated ion channel 20, chloroplastic isoform X2 [Brassica napus]|uniref:probable cyclic nucleotide-gated ion channel 20, chloroplastic isoform X2 n=1 Tax=Brassica napus TaxID=3708 RepID=UPI0020790B41|nr:probable cyclic nucleotide-gated ion channel 20, chloroplastic isoform X2 [Brassica napus]
MPDDLQRDIRRHLFKFLNKVRIFTLMDESILNAIRERLKHITYISSSVVFSAGDVIEKIVFIVRGEMESIGKDGSVISLSEGDVFGEELLSWCLERAASNTAYLHIHHIISLEEFPSSILKRVFFTLSNMSKSSHQVRTYFNLPKDKNVWRI